VHTLAKVAADMQRKTGDGRCSVEDLLNGPPTQINIEAYQRQIGLPAIPFYGGETTCVQVDTADGNVIILDAGSGIRRASLELVRRWQNRSDRTLYLFGSHEHLDHRSGLTFARFCYVGDNPFTLRIYGSQQFLFALDQHYGLFSRVITDMTYVDDPIDFHHMPARFIGTEFRIATANAQPRQKHWEVRDIGPIRIGNTTVTPFEVYHGIACCLAYKIEHGGKSFVFCTDHELRRGEDENNPRQKRSREAEQVLRRHCMNADLAYMDGQYFLEEYLGHKGIGDFPPVKRVDWGHGCVEDIVDRAVACNIRRTLVGHHDPERSWPERHEMDRNLAKLSAGKPNQLQLADSDLVIEL
jgi:phosphoribosyl 1,2-cyclic phosphodiesterase